MSSNVPQIVFGLPADLDGEIRAAAERNGRSLAGELRVAVRRHLERDAHERVVNAMTDEQLDAVLAAAGIAERSADSSDRSLTRGC